MYRRLYWEAVPIAPTLEAAEGGAGPGAGAPEVARPQPVRPTLATGPQRALARGTSRMDHADHINLLRNGVSRAQPRTGLAPADPPVEWEPS